MPATGDTTMDGATYASSSDVQAEALPPLPGGEHAPPEPEQILEIPVAAGASMEDISGNIPATGAIDEGEERPPTASTQTNEAPVTPTDGKAGAHGFDWFDEDPDWLAARRQELIDHLQHAARLARNAEMAGQRNNSTQQEIEGYFLEVAGRETRSLKVAFAA